MSAFSKFFLYGLINSPPILWRILSAWSQKIFVELQNLFSCLLQRHFELKMMLCSFDFRLALLWMCSTCTRWFSSQADIALDWNYRKDWSDTCRLRRYSFIPTRSVSATLVVFLRESLISYELGFHSLGRDIPGTLPLLDTICMVLVGVVVSTRILWLWYDRWKDVVSWVFENESMITNSIHFKGVPLCVDLREQDKINWRHSVTTRSAFTVHRHSVHIESSLFHKVAAIHPPVVRISKSRALNIHDLVWFMAKELRIPLLFTNPNPCLSQAKQKHVAELASTARVFWDICTNLDHGCN